MRNIEAEPQTLNPITASDAYEVIVNAGIYEALLTRDFKTANLKPSLAESWEISEDKLTFTFRLKQNVKWHDGKSFTAEDVKYTFDRIKDPKVDAPHLRVYFNDIASCEVLDPYTVRFRCTKKYFKTLETLGFGIIPKHIFNDGQDFNKHTAGRHPIGTGPYRFVRWDTGSQIIVERNPDYRWGDPVYLNRIVFKVLTDETVTLQLLKRGDIDMYDRILPTQWVRQLNDPKYDQRFHKFSYDYPSYNYIGWNLRKPPFNDKRVRQALDLLVDRDKIISQVYLGMASKTSGFSFIKDPSYNSTVPPTPFDPQRAIKLLDEAGWRDSNGDGVRDKNGKPFEFTFLFTAGNERAEKIGLTFQEDLKKVGIQMELKRLEWAVFLQQVQQWNFDSVSLGWALAFDMDPYQIWHSSQAKQKNSSNAIGYENPEADKIMEIARQEFDAPKRHELYRKLHEIIYHDYPVVFLTVPKQLMAVDRRFTNIHIYAIRPCYDIGEWFVPVEKQRYR